MTNPSTDLTLFQASATEPIRAYGERFWYLASSYDHIDAKVRKQRVETIRRVVAGIIKKHSHDDIVPFSPVLYTSQIDAYIQPTHGWYRFDLYFLEKAERLVVVQMEGWQASKGIQIETAFALGKGIPIEYLNPDVYLEDLE